MDPARPPDVPEPAPPLLPDPARHQLVGLAADLVGRLPAEDVPAGLRAVARFAPAKRRRLGAVALAAALDADDGFRARLAGAVEETSPDLVAAVRTGAPTAASDPVDVAVVAYLVRPDGWAAIVDEANRRMRATRPSDDAEVATLRAEVQQLRARARAEPARVRDAVAAATAAAEAELADLRRTVRERTRRQRAAEQELETLRVRLQENESALERQAAGHEAELRRLRARASELERSAEAARRGTKVARDVDDARLWLLVDTLVQAATGVRRELSLAPPDTRPSDAVAATLTGAGTGTVTGPGGRSAADPGALDRLLAMPNVHLVVDGYNVTKTGYGDLSLDQQRTRLVGALAPLAARSGAEVTVVFDGGQKPPVRPITPRGVRVLFSAADEIADDLIRRLVAAEPVGRPVVVATSDRAVVTDTGRDGAWSVPSAVLLARLG